MGRLLRKYDTFCYCLGYLDSGVAAAYVQLAADAVGIGAFPMPIGHDVAVARAIGATFPHPRALPAFAFALGAPASFELGTASTDEPEMTRSPTRRATSSEIGLRELMVAARSPSLRVVAESPLGHVDLGPLPLARSLDSVLESRRSHRRFGRALVPPSDVGAILRAARAAPIHVSATPWFAPYMRAIDLAWDALREGTTEAALLAQFARIAEARQVKAPDVGAFVRACKRRFSRVLRGSSRACIRA